MPRPRRPAVSAERLAGSERGDRGRRRARPRRAPAAPTREHGRAGRVHAAAAAHTAPGERLTCLCAPGDRRAARREPRSPPGPAGPAAEPPAARPARPAGSGAALPGAGRRCASAERTGRLCAAAGRAGAGQEGTRRAGVLRSRLLLCYRDRPAACLCFKAAGPPHRCPWGPARVKNGLLPLAFGHRPEPGEAAEGAAGLLLP